MEEIQNGAVCPAESLMKMLAGKWKLHIFKLAIEQPVRFSFLLKNIEGANKQSLSIALKELEESDLLSKKVVQEKPLHIEYSLTPKAEQLIPIFHQIEQVFKNTST